VRRDVYLKPILERIANNPELGLVDLNREAGALLLKACLLLDFPQEWLDGERGMDPDCVESIALLLGDALEAVRAEIDEPTRPLELVCGGDA